MTFQEAQKRRQKAYEVQEAVTNIRVEQIFDIIDKQDLRDFIKEYFR